jgi:hypothetical protein
MSGFRWGARSEEQILGYHAHSAGPSEFSPFRIPNASYITGSQSRDTLHESDPRKSRRFIDSVSDLVSEYIRVPCAISCCGDLGGDTQ